MTYAMRNQDQAVELLPCPFCGAEGKMGYVRDGLRAHCRACFASGPPEYNGLDGRDGNLTRAIAAWNRRASPHPGGRTYR
jgi:hypothetical protein